MTSDLDPFTYRLHQYLLAELAIPTNEIMDLPLLPEAQLVHAIEQLAKSLPPCPSGFAPMLVTGARGNRPAQLVLDALDRPTRQALSNKAWIVLLQRTSPELTTPDVAAIITAIGGILRSSTTKAQLFDCPPARVLVIRQPDPEHPGIPFLVHRGKALTFRDPSEGLMPGPVRGSGRITSGQQALELARQLFTAQED